MSALHHKLRVDTAKAREVERLDSPGTCSTRTPQVSLSSVLHVRVPAQHVRT